MSYYTNGNTASEMIARADANYEWQERREWERAHLPPPGDGVEKKNARPHAPERSDGSVQADVGGSECPG